MSIRNNVGIIYSEASRQVFITDAKMKGDIYSFRGSRAEVQWIREGAYLAVNGLASILRRFGIKFDILREEECSVGLLESYHTIFCPNACHLLEQAIVALGGWLKGDRMLVVSGSSNLPEQLLGNEDVRECVGDGWTSVIISEGTIYFPRPIFEYIGGILQGHTCIEHLRKQLGDSSNFYVDMLACRIKDILFNYGCGRLWEIQLKPWGGYDNVLVLRHDTDYSDDPSYLDYEIETGTSATYAILPDRNREFYLSKITPHAFLEASFHFGSYYHLPFLGVNSRTAKRRAITGKGLAKQISRARNKYGIPCDTLHKHGNPFFYPETIEAMDYLYENFPETIGMGTMFRFRNIKYSLDSYTLEEPDVSVPFWFPFKMVVSSVEKHKTLRGWDTTSFIEPPPYLIDLMFDNSLVLLNGVYMLGFHPAHAKKDTFNVGGDFEWFLYAVNEAKKRGWWVANYKTVCQKLNDWENLVLRVESGVVVLENPTDGDIADVTVGCGDGKGDWHIPLIKAHSREALG